MKRILYLWCTLLLFAFAGCSSDKYDMEDDSQNEEIYLLQANLGPEFSKGYKSSHVKDTTFTDDNNTEITRDINGVVKLVYFYNTPMNSRPLSPEQFVSTYLGVDLNANFKMYRQEVVEYGYTNSWYRQYYKDVEVEKKGYVFHYDNKNKRIHSVNGSGYLPINSLDVTPAFSGETARKIYAKYLNMSVERIEENVSLYIVEFPLSAESDLWAPRLVYKLAVVPVVDGIPFNYDKGLCYIDAKTGRILYVWENYIHE